MNAVSGQPANSNRNFIYSKLVKNPNDIFGAIAYSIYKRQKIEIIKKFEQEHDGKQPSNAELKPFNDLSNTKDQLNFYNEQARQLAQLFLSKALEEELRESEKRLAKEKAKNDEVIAEKVKKKFTVKSFWLGVFQSLIASILFIIITGLVGFYMWTYGQSKLFMEKVENKITIEQPKEQSQSQTDGE